MKPESDIEPDRIIKPGLAALVDYWICCIVNCLLVEK